MSESVTRREVSRITAQWRRGPRVTVVPDASHFPELVSQDANGLFCAEGVFVVERPTCEVAEVLLHEAVAHHGLRSLLGPRHWPEMMLAIREGVREGDPQLHVIDRGVRRVYGELRPRLAADENAARLAELRADAHTGRLRVAHPIAKRWAAMRGRVARSLLHCRAPASRDEIEGILLEAEALIRDGWCCSVPWWWWYLPAMPKPMGASKPPRSVAESERWLKAARDRERLWPNVKAFWAVVFFILALPMFVVCLLWSTVDVFGWLR